MKKRPIKNNVFFLSSNDLTRSIQSVLVTEYGSSLYSFRAEVKKNNYVFVTSRHSKKLKFYIDRLKEEIPELSFIYWGYDSEKDSFRNEEQILEFDHKFFIRNHDEIESKIAVLSEDRVSHE